MDGYDDTRQDVSDQSAHRASRASRPQARTRSRLTARGRFVVLVFFLLVSFALVSVSSALHAATQAGTGPASPATRYVTVQAGQTLWQIALRVAPKDDPRDTVDRIRSLNGLGTSTTSVLPGQRLVVPA